ncbi:uncharacterized protein L3040_005354 [Drepanopeziza brunnea f. sp. 'multigermtubi']|uniref:Uncharacterized protein n=1 Tax=Marssonina brunnea f. sp. multigermtubi (strain MB_m1) TaxID=1072389 RepID=K1XWN9_MARBU|nr:uncharacterized protein MBM_04711 [Drepanopeziza brunnea f. sp. 'multigermtubi' MB_m1]EKD17134.1 hypothetical protein MBM_04711 [Drepanopeziza brunnea f. sp. 'multigermtubi' MB_m1]KAJ5041786.1 hypothetical protein L3040_005354 [Drepanopeziza brunnea f. sp. 'multigermtubi']
MLLLVQNPASRRSLLGIPRARVIPYPLFSKTRLRVCCRLSSTSTTPAPKVPIGKKFPERLLIYHAGTPRTVFLGCTKVTTIFLCIFFCTVMAPTHFHGEESNWVAAGVMLSGLVPVSYVAYTSAPFVTYIHLRLPAFARQSQQMLLRYSKSLPKNAEIDITTMNFVGKPRVARVKLADLYPVRRRWGFANYARDTQAIDARRPWYLGKAVALFGVHNEKSGVMDGQVWDHVAAAIAKNKRN